MIENPYKPFTYRWWVRWTYVPRRVWMFLGRLFAYIPVIWNDNDWDYDSILHVIRFKLERMEPLILSGFSAHAEDRALEIRTALNLLSKINEDPDDEWSEHYSRWHTGTVEDFTGPCKAGDEQCRAVLEASHRRTERNWHRLWRYLDKHMRKWWD